MKISVRDLTRLSIVAAIYVILTLAFTPLSYGDIQFRISEVLMLLIVYRRKYAISMILGCFVANLFSPIGWVDIVFGTLATVIAAIPMMFIKNLEISSFLPSIANGLVVGLELSIVYDLPIVITMAQVFIGEFVVCSLIGIPLFHFLEKNESFMRTIDAKPLANRWVNPFVSITLAINIINIICFLKLELHNEYTSFNLLKKQDFLALSILLLPLISFISMFILKGYINVCVNFIIALAFTGFLIGICANNSPDLSYYLYFIIPIFIILIDILFFNNIKFNE